MLQTTLLKFFSLSHQKPHNNLLLSRSSGTANMKEHQAGGLQSEGLPLLCCSLRSTTGPQTQAFWNKNRHPWAWEPEVLPLLVLLKCRCTFRCRNLFFWSISSLCSSCKSDFCLVFFFLTYLSTLGFMGRAYIYLITNWLSQMQCIVHTQCTHILLTTVTWAQSAGRSSKTMLEICQSHSHWSTWGTPTTPA